MLKKSITIICMLVLLWGIVYAGFGERKKAIFDAFVAKDQAAFQAAMEAAAADPAFSDQEVDRWTEVAYRKKGLNYTPTQKTLIDMIMRAMVSENLTLFKDLTGDYAYHVESSGYDREAMISKFMEEQAQLVAVCAENLDLAKIYHEFFWKELLDKQKLSTANRGHFFMILKRAGDEYGTKLPEETAIGKANVGALSVLAMNAAMSLSGLDEEVLGFFKAAVLQAVIQPDVEHFGARVEAIRTGFGEASELYSKFLAGRDTELQQRIKGRLDVKIFNSYIGYWEDLFEPVEADIKAFVESFLEGLEGSEKKVKEIDGADYATLKATAQKYDLNDIAGRLDVIRTSG